MKIDPTSRLGGVLVTLAGHLARLALFAIGSTLRLEIVGEGHLAELRRRPRPVIVSFWHGHAFLAAHVLYRWLHRRGVDLTLLASQSRDGEMVSRMVGAWGIETVRGSSSRGGMQALRALHRAITRRGTSPVMIPDGPRGPAEVFKLGVAVLAQTSGAPILPFGFAAASCWRLGSWDRLVVPRPFSRVAVVIGEPRVVPPRLQGAELEAERADLERLLIALDRRAVEVLSPGGA